MQLADIETLFEACKDYEDSPGNFPITVFFLIQMGFHWRRQFCVEPQDVRDFTAQIFQSANFHRQTIPDFTRAGSGICFNQVPFI